ncbi:MAG: SpoIIE family protein phosphatase [Clostridia bacterium]|nr:SpoIIE family protein phosphatase [Clostridia bacterium]
MDKLKEKTEDTTTKKRSGLFSIFGTSREKESGHYSWLYDLFYFTVGLLLSRCHLLFGAYPLGISFVSLLPEGIFPALIGSVIGSLTLGKGGIVYAAVFGVIVVLRMIISAGKDKNTSFDENLLLRMSFAVIGGFVCALSEILIRGFETTSIFFGISMITLSPLATFALSGLFGSETNLRSVISAKENVLSLKKKNDKQQFDIVFFEISGAVLCFFIALSLNELVYFGISVSYIFTTFATLLVARRFGALRAAALGFISSLGVGGVYSVAFSLLGLTAGALFNVSSSLAIIGGGAAAALWGSYIAGMSGMLTTLPEYIIGAALVTPFLKNVVKPIEEPEEEEPSISAEDMVGTVALSYQNKYSRSLNLLEESLTSLSSVIKDFSEAEVTPSADAYKNLVMCTADKHCKNCTGLKFCMVENIRPCLKNADAIAKKLTEGIKICPEDVNTDTEFCQKAEAVAASINDEVAKREESSFKHRDSGVASEEYSLVSKLINDARLQDSAERSVNSSVTVALTDALKNAGLEGGVIRAFGERRKHVILAAEDESGEKITSPQLNKELERALGVRLGTPEYFRKGKMALMECDTRRSYAIEYACASAPANETEASGDTICCFESGDDYFYSLISDGMGSGEVAERTSKFVSNFLIRALDFAGAKETVLHMLNHAIRRGGEECSATVDLFEVDLLSGEATFIKSGAAPSFVKRGTSLFRIRSQTAPIGLMKSIDTERIRVEIKDGDYVIMLSDGIVEVVEDTPWLIELLANTNPQSLSSFASQILNCAKERSNSGDDMSVAVIKITRL